MNYRRLGRTGLHVSEIALGTVELGLDYGLAAAGETLRPTEADAARLLNRALDLGVNLIDTARAYGEAEAIIGRALKTRRKEYILATKVRAPDDAHLTGQALRAFVQNSVATSLRMLQTDYVDMLYLHSATEEYLRQGEYLQFMQEAQQAGHARFVGASTYGEEAPLIALADGGYDFIQIAYNLLDRTPEARVLPLAQQKDVGIVIRSVLLKGALTHRYTALPDHLAELKAAVRQLMDMADGGDLPELAYRFVLAHPAVASALVGTGRVHELERAVEYARRPRLPEDLLERIGQVVLRDPSLANPGTWGIP